MQNNPRDFSRAALVLQRNRFCGLQVGSIHNAGAVRLYGLANTHNHHPLEAEQCQATSRQHH